VQDAAYSTMLRSQRQDLHARIGKVLEDQFPEIVGNQPEILAHHFTQAGLVDPAIEFWRRAGVHSIERSAHSEAAGHFESALDLLGELPPSRHRDECDLDLTLALGVPLIAVHGFGSLRVEERALRAKELSDAPPLAPPVRHPAALSADRVESGASLTLGQTEKSALSRAMRERM
jgi:predicted ATPase